MKKLKKPLRIIGTFLEWFVFGALIALYAIVLSPNLPTKKYVSTYIVSTGSMQPTVQPGSIALIKQGDTKQIKKNDIIIFISPKDPNQTVLHRVFAVKQKDKGIEFETKGDNNNAPDNWTVSESSIKGIYFGRIPLLGHPAAFLKTQKGFLLLFGIPALILVLLQVKKIREGIEEEVQKRVRTEEEKKKKTDILSSLIFLILTGITGFAGIQTAQALFVSKATASSISFSVKDFVPPDKPKNLHWNNPDVSCGGATNSYTITADWDNGIDVGGSGIDHYEYNITYPKLGGGTGNSTITVISSQYSEVFNQDNGVHTYKVRAWDNEGNVSEWSDTCSITYDSKSPPLPTIYQWGGGKVINSSSLVQCWSIVNDLYSNPVTYEYESYNDPGYESLRWKGTFGNANIGICGTFGPAIIKNAQGAPEGPVYYRIRTKDALGNISGWLSDYFIIDNTAPSTATLSVTGSWTKKVEDHVDNGGFENGVEDWNTAGYVATTGSETIGTTTVMPTSGSTMARIGQTSGDAGNYTWDNRLMQSFPTGSKSLSLWYNFFTTDTGSYDNPGFFMKLNGTDIFHQSSWMTNPLDGSGTTAYSTGWTQLFYNLSTITDPYTNLIMSAGNTGDTTDKQSWVYIDEVTTYIVAAPSHATYTFSGDDPSAKYFCKITPDVGFASDFTDCSSPFTIEDNGPHTLEYYAQDPAGNKSGVYTAKIITDATAPSAPDNFIVQSISGNNATLTWTATGDDNTLGRSASYDLRYSTNEILTDKNFEEASTSGTVSSPTLSGHPEHALIEGLTPGTLYYFALKVLDEAPNASAMVTASAKTLEGLMNNSGDVVINELMWAGTSLSPNDIWLELRNMTDRTIDLSGWHIKSFDETTFLETDFLITSGSIAPKGFFVISKLPANSSSLKTTDLVIPTLTLSRTNLLVTLTDNASTPNDIDVAWNPYTSLSLSSYVSGTYYRSMERTEVPGDGTDPFRWYPCIDEVSTTEFFDVTPFVNYGTPGVKNRSENEPLIYEFFKQATVSGILKEPTITLSHNEKIHTVSFIVSNVEPYTSLSWELSYDTDPSIDSELESTQQGAVGTSKLIGEKEYTKNDILLGTCTTGGNCTYHTGIKNMKISIMLKDADGKETMIEKTQE